jgi:capsid protein
VIVQNNVIGSGIGLQAQVMSTRGELRESVNDALEQAFSDWSCAERCHTGGTLHFADLERALMGQVFEAGEIFVRKHARAFGDSAVPFALELIEPERLVDEFMQPVPQAPLADGAVVKMGIEVDRFGRPLAYWIRTRHPGRPAVPARRDATRSSACRPSRSCTCAWSTAGRRRAASPGCTRSRGS